MRGWRWRWIAGDTRIQILLGSICKVSGNIATRRPLIRVFFGPYGTIVDEVQAVDSRGKIDIDLLNLKDVIKFANQRVTFGRKSWGGMQPGEMVIGPLESWKVGEIAGKCQSPNPGKGFALLMLIWILSRVQVGRAC